MRHPGFFSKYSVFICVVVFLLFFGVSVLQAAIPASERAALIAFYNAVGGDAAYQRGWKDGPLEPDGFALVGTEHTWDGVDVSGDHVVEFAGINSSGGTISPQLENLTQLNSLDLSFMGLTGTIPPELGNLGNLRTLDLRGNSLTGAIPPELGNLSKLGLLILCRNSFSGSIPPELGNLSNLIELRLRSCNLSGKIPPEIGNLTRLEELVLASNNLGGKIPASITNLTGLRGLEIYCNALYTDSSVVKAFLDQFSPSWDLCQRYVMQQPVLAAQNSILIRSGVVVEKGDVCVVAPGTALDHNLGCEVVLLGSAFLAEGCSVYADKVKMGANVSVEDVFCNSTEGGVVRGDVYQPLALPLDDILPDYLLPMPEPVPGTEDVVVEEYQTRTLSPGAYGDMVLGVKSRLLLNWGDYHIKDLVMKDYAEIRCLGPVRLIIANRLASETKPYILSGDGSQIGPDSFLIYVYGKNGVSGNYHDLPRAAVIGIRHRVEANIIVPNGTLRFKSRGSCLGMFYAKDMVVDFYVTFKKFFEL